MREELRRENSRGKEAITTGLYGENHRTPP